MAALETAITNIYEPSVASAYLLEQTTEKSLLVQSGIAAADPTVSAAALQGGRNFEMPFWDDLAHDTGTTTRSKVATDDDTAITPVGVTTDYDIAHKHFRTQAWRAASVVKHIAGADPLQVFVDRYVDWWVREEQRLLLKSLYGCFQDATVKANLANDIAGEVTTTDAAKLIGSDAILDTRFKLGDAYEKLTAMIMHSVPYKRLVKLGLIDFVPTQDQSMSIPSYMGIRVIVDDTMTTVAGSTSGYKYYTYLFGAGAIARVDLPLGVDDPAFEVYRNPTLGTGSGSVEVITRKYFVMHPRGIKFTATPSVSPSDAELIADNWDQVYLTKNIRIALLITNG